MLRQRSALLALSFVAMLLACSAQRTSAPREDPGATTVLVRNVSQRTLTAVHIVTSEADQFSEATLGPGQATGAHAVQAIHSAVAVEATADGQQMSALPVEGFTGFNPPLEPGAYVVTIDVVAATGDQLRLIVNVEPANEGTN